VRRDGKRVYVTARGHGADQGQIIIVDPDARSVLKTIFSFGNSPNCLRISHDGSSVFVANSGFPSTDPSFPPHGSDLTRITQFKTADDPTLTTASFFSDIPRPIWIALTPDGGQLYATSADFKEVQIFDTTSHQKIASVDTGADEPTGIVVVAIS
jgi:YVTN family beta-propeller protein